MNKVLYLIYTPFQLFNAIEAKQRFHQRDKNILIFIDKGNETNRKQIEFILDKEHFDQIIYIPFKTLLQKKFYHWQLKSTLAQLNQISRIYLALFRHVGAHIINRTKPKEVWVIDDGNRTLTVVDQFFSGKIKNDFNRHINTLLGKDTDLSFIYDAHFFSSYTEIKHRVRYFTHNDYQYSKQKIQHLKQSDDAYLIGSKLINDSISIQNFELILIRMVHYAKQRHQSLYYIPHRHENLDYISQLADKYQFKLMILETVLEYHLSLKNELPKHLYTFRSTAVDSLHQIYNTPVTVFIIPPEWIKPNKRNEFKTLYQHYAHKQFKLIPLNEKL